MGFVLLSSFWQGLPLSTVLSNSVGNVGRILLCACLDWNTLCIDNIQLKQFRLCKHHSYLIFSVHNVVLVCKTKSHLRNIFIFFSFHLLGVESTFSSPFFFLRHASALINKDYTFLVLKQFR